MIQMSISQMAQIMGGKHQGEVTIASRANFHFDSRQIYPGDVFLALKGERADGYEFVSDAFSRGAALSIVNRPVASAYILVEDVLVALGKLAKHIRSELKSLKVIGITGSQGKTTCKDLLYSILSSQSQTIASYGSFNNDLGVPLTLLRCSEMSKYCILEMGARNSGDIAALTELANPDIGAVLKVGNAHIGQFGTEEMIAKTKGELIASLKPGATAVLGTYDRFTPEMASGQAVKRITFGESAKCDVRAADIEAKGGFAHFELVIGSERHGVELQLLGLHQIANALGAAAIASALGVSSNQIASSLSNHQSISKWRMELIEGNGLTLINDSYNANPESMEAALKVLSLLAQDRGGRCWAFLGRMHELGEESDRMHEAIGKRAEELGIDHLIAIGIKAYLSQINQSRVTGHHFATWQESEILFPEFSSGDVILVKASRAEALDELASAIKSSLMIESEGESR